MGLRALIGLQWGDEGKGKIVDALSRDLDLVVRAQGGANAGHTVTVQGTTRVLHLVPSGMLFPEVTGVIGNGVVVDPRQLLRELDDLAASGHDVTGRLLVSDRAHLVLPYHAELDVALEELRGGAALGTTRRGIGPAYQDKAARAGLRVGELLDPPAFRQRLEAEVEVKNRFLSHLGREPLDVATLAEDLQAAGERVAPLVGDTVSHLHEALDAGRRILLEGAQGSLLDIDLGTYPFVTSSSCHVGGLLAGSGLPPRALQGVLGVAKAYCTRVGSGPFPTEDHGEAGEALRARGREFGATTGRPRRCGWLDLVALRYAVRANGVAEIALTKADVLAGQPAIRVCTEYRLGAELLRHFPAGRALERVEPVYRELPGFDQDIAEVRADDELPAALRDLISLVEDEVEARVSLISTGPERSQMIRR